MEKDIGANMAIAEELAKFHLADGRWSVHVKPYTLEIKEELEAYRKSKYATKGITVTEENGTYCITSTDIMYDFRDLRGSLWFMIFWRLRCEARSTFATVIEGGNTRKMRWCENKMNMAFNDENKEYNFYVVALSPQLIEATCLPRFHIPNCA